MNILFLNKRYKVGGVGNYYRVLRQYFSNAYFMDLSYSKSKYGIYDFLLKYVFFISNYRKLLNNNLLQVVVFNPSLGKVALFRDYPYHLLASLKRKRQIIFFRGWRDDFSNTITSSRFHRFLFNQIYLKRADAYIVLSDRFKNKLLSWGVDKPIYVETTMVEEKMLSNFDIRKKDFQKKEILFLSRLEKDKGIFEAIQAINLLSANNSDLQFNIAGDGSAYEELKCYIFDNGSSGIKLLGYIKGEDKINSFRSATLFVFPSAHGEGMPNSVLEAMAFGLPVVTTRVGGIPDFFEDGKMGLFLDSQAPEHISEKIQYLLERPELMKKISEYNYYYAKEHFYASKVAARLGKIIDDIINSNNRTDHSTKL